MLRRAHIYIALIDSMASAARSFERFRDEFDRSIALSTQHRKELERLGQRARRRTTVCQLTYKRLQRIDHARRPRCGLPRSFSFYQGAF